MILKSISVYRTAKVKIHASQLKKLDSIMHNRHCVIVIAGDHKGHKGHVKRRMGSFLFISGLFRTKATKKGVLNQYSKIHVSNVMHYSIEDDIASRVFVQYIDGIKQYFYCKNKRPISIFKREKKEPAPSSQEASDEAASEDKDGNIMKEEEKADDNNNKE